jgi:uncharacterized protein with HEPN domain
MSEPVREWRTTPPCATLELIGEAATHVPDDVRQAHPDVPWRMMVATRNRLIHAYLGIDNDTLWSIVTGDVPALLPALRAVQMHPPAPTP